MSLELYLLLGLALLTLVALIVTIIVYYRASSYEVCREG